MIAKTNTERSKALRERRRIAGLKEVRNIWSPPNLHAELRSEAAKIIGKRKAKGKTS